MAIPFLNHLDLTDVSQLQNALLHKTTSAVATAVEAKIIYDTGTNTIKYYDGTQWIELGGDTDNYVDGASLSSNTLTLTRTGSLANITVDLSSLAVDNYVDSLAFDTSTGVLTLGRTGSLADLTVDLDGRYQAAGNYDNYQQWQITDGSQTDNVTSDQVVKFVANSTPGTAGAALTGNGTTADPYVVTYTFPNDNDDNYVDSASLSGTTLTLGRTGALADLTVDLSSLDEIVNDNSITIEAGTYLSLGSGQDGIFTLNQNSDETITIDHDATSRSDTTSSGSPAAGATFTAIDSVSTNTQGHVTAVNTKTITLPADNNTDTLQSIAADTSNNDRFITTVADASGAQTGFSHSTLKYNPSTETLSVTNLIVAGTSTTVNTETISLADNIITLNSNYAGSTPSENAGIEIERGTLDNVQLNWDESDDDWEFTAYNHASTPALTTYKIPRTYSTTVGDSSAPAGSYSEAVNHYLGTRNVIVQLFDSSSYETVHADVVRTNTNTVTLTFAAAPSTGDITVLISTVNS